MTAPSDYELIESASVTLDGSGNGTVRWSPGQVAAGSSGGGGISRKSGYIVHIVAVSVSVATKTLEASAATYVSYGVQSFSANDFVGQTQLGSTGDTCTITVSLRPGDWITTVWTGGDAGKIATMKISGTVTPAGSV